MKDGLGQQTLPVRAISCWDEYSLHCYLLVRSNAPMSGAEARSAEASAPLAGWAAGYLALPPFDDSTFSGGSNLSTFQLCTALDSAPQPFRVMDALNPTQTKEPFQALRHFGQGSGHSGELWLATL